MSSGRCQRALILISLVAAFMAGEVRAQSGTWMSVGSPPAGGEQLWDVEVLDDRMFAFTNGPAGMKTYEVVAPCDLAAGPVEWVELEPSPGIAKSYFRAAALDGKIYLPGGGLASSASTDEVVIFTPPADLADLPGDDGSWEFGTPLPVPVNGYALATVGDEIFLAGGCCGNRSDLMVFNGMGWPIVAPVFASPARDLPAGAAVNGDTFVALGGYFWTSGPTVCDVDINDPTGSHDGPMMPTCRNSHAAAACGDLVYVVGGTGPGGLLTAVDILDTAAGTWSSGPAMLSPTGFTSAAWWRGRLWVFPLMAPDLVQVLTPESGDCQPEETLHSCACDAEATRNHGQYVSCVARVTQQMVREGRMTRDQRQAVLTEAAQSDVGKR